MFLTSLFLLIVSLCFFFGGITDCITCGELCWMVVVSAILFFASLLLVVIKVITTVIR